MTDKLPSYTPFSKRAWHYRARQIALRNNDRCEVCGSDRSLQVHHVNGDWTDNDIGNLAVLCKHHHVELHRL